LVKCDCWHYLRLCHLDIPDASHWDVELSEEAEARFVGGLWVGRLVSDRILLMKVESEELTCCEVYA
jgi:hypothetical protein